MDGLSEMVQLFPTMNPIVEFVDLFVDPALANCVAASYWLLVLDAKYYVYLR